MTCWPAFRLAFAFVRRSILICILRTACFQRVISLAPPDHDQSGRHGAVKSPSKAASERQKAREESRIYLRRKAILIS
jgi:hypothetical protein